MLNFSINAKDIENRNVSVSIYCNEFEMIRSKKFLLLHLYKTSALSIGDVLKIVDETDPMINKLSSFYENALFLPSDEYDKFVEFVISKTVIFGKPNLL